MWQNAAEFHKEIRMIKEMRNLSNVRGPHECRYAEHTRSMSESKSDEHSGM